MSGSLLASVVISSYNYGRFLQRAIDSALDQTYPNTEVIVVDDCSTDDSREIIARYGERITPVLRDKNQGGRATYNEVCLISRGDVIFLLDSDDMLCPTVVEQAVALFKDPDVVKVHWPLWEINKHDGKTGRIVPCRVLPEGDVREQVKRHGPWNYASPPTTGNAWSRRFLEEVLPVPAGTYCDAYLSLWAWVLGRVRSLPEPQAFYRVHGQNGYGAKGFDQRLEKDLRFVDLCCDELRQYYEKKGIPVDTEAWKKNSWHCHISRSVQELQELVPSGDTFILVDEDNWATGGSVAGRRALPFPEQDGYYGGPPPDDAAAIAEFERLRRLGANCIVFTWQALWWLDYYSEFQQYLAGRFPCIRKNERIVAFDLRQQDKFLGNLT